MGTELVAVRDELHSQGRVEILRDVLAPYRLPVEAWRASFLDTLQGSSTLKYVTDLQSVISSAVTIAVLGLRMDRASAQSCLVPFRSRGVSRAQPIVMVQGYTTIAGRSGFVMQAHLIREGDKWSEIKGSTPGIHHVPGHKTGAKAIATYAVARSVNHPTLFSDVMMLDEIIAVRDRSKGYISARDNGASHPWVTDFEAMMRKTPKRRIQKDIPNDQLAQAGWLDTMHDLGRGGYISPEGRGVEVGVEEGPVIMPDRQPGISDTEDLTAAAQPLPKIEWSAGPDDRLYEFEDPGAWQRWLLENIARVKDAAKIKANTERNRDRLDLYEKVWPDNVKVVRQALKERGVT